MKYCPLQMPHWWPLKAGRIGRANDGGTLLRTNPVIKKETKKKIKELQQQQQQQLARPVRHLVLFYDCYWQNYEKICCCPCITALPPSMWLTQWKLNQFWQVVPIPSLALCQEGCMRQPMISNVLMTPCQFAHVCTFACKIILNILTVTPSELSYWCGRGDRWFFTRWWCKLFPNFLDHPFHRCVYHCARY